MAQTQTVQEHLTAVRDELKAAVQKRDADAKTHINTALEHARMANADLKAEIAASNPKTKQQAQDTMKHLDELVENGKKALNEAGDQLHNRVDTMITHAKEAIQASKA